MIDKMISRNTIVMSYVNVMEKPHGRDGRIWVKYEEDPVMHQICCD